MSTDSESRVRLIDRAGSDEGIISCARMSTDGAFRGWGSEENCAFCFGTGLHENHHPYGNYTDDGKLPCRSCHGSGKHTKSGDEKLLGYLYREGHSTPFESGWLHFEIETPVFVARQIFRHRAFSYSEVSGRYVEYSDRFWLPNRDQIRAQGKGGSRQVGSGTLPEEDAEDAEEVFRAAYCKAREAYSQLLHLGVCREQARAVIPLGLYTKFRMMGKLRDWLHFLALRLDKHAQEETREVARLIHEEVVRLFPRTCELFATHGPMSAPNPFLR